MTRVLIQLLVILAMTAAFGPAETHSEEWDDLPVKDSERIRKSFDLSAGPAQKVVELDNVNGSIEVAGTDSSQAHLVVTRATRARSPEKLEQARKEVTLEITERPGSLTLYVNGPFRCRCDGREGFSFRERPGYDVRMDFQLQVPRQADVTLRTVNGGEVRLRDIRGRFEVSNVNGGVEVQRVAGSGRAHSVNGPVKVTFTENPRQASSFKSVNGDLDLYFARGLSADFRLKTFNGSIYTDFPVTALPVRAIQREQSGRKMIFRADRFTGGRIGAGGVEIHAENFNGDIRIRENQ